MVMSVTLNRLRRRQSLQPTDVSVNRHTHKSDELLPSLSRAAHAQTASAPVQSVRRISPSNRRRSAAASLCRRVRPSVRRYMPLSLSRSLPGHGWLHLPASGRPCGRQAGRPTGVVLPTTSPSSRPFVGLLRRQGAPRRPRRTAPRRAVRCGAARTFRLSARALSSFPRRR